MEICSASENGEVYEHIPDKVLIERLKKSEQKILDTKKLIDALMDDLIEKAKQGIRPVDVISVLEAFAEVRKSLTG